MSDTSRIDYDRLVERLGARGLDVVAIEQRLADHRIETPSWGYANAGTRFGSYPPEGLPSTPFEKFDDAAEVHRLTGSAPSVAIHIPWDQLENYSELKSHAASLGLEVGTVNPNLFGDKRYKLGSLANPDAAVRRLATDHMLECIEIAREVGSTGLSLWLPDGTNYAGQDSFVARRRRLHESLAEVYASLDPDMELLVEYKLYEPAFYASELGDWGASLLTCQKLGPKAKVLVDLGHHAQGVNIEQIVAFLEDEDRLGGFHFNNRKYGDDDLIVGSVNPFELFLIYTELAAMPRLPRLTIDQAFVIESKIEGMVLSVVNLQEAFAKALLVDRVALAERQANGDVLGAHELLLDAFRTDVRPLTAKVREEKGAAADPVAAFRDGDWWERVGSRRDAAATTGGLGA